MVNGYVNISLTSDIGQKSFGQYDYFISRIGGYSIFDGLSLCFSVLVNKPL